MATAQSLVIGTSTPRGLRGPESLRASVWIATQLIIQAHNSIYIHHRKSWHTLRGPGSTKGRRIALLILGVDGDVQQEEE